MLARVRNGVVTSMRIIYPRLVSSVPSQSRGYAQKVRFVAEMPSMKQVMNNLAISCKKAIEEIKDDEEFSIHADFGQRFLKEGRFKLTVSDDGTEGVLTKTEGNQLVEVKFPLEYEEDLDEDEEELEDEEHEGEEAGGEHENEDAAYDEEQQAEVEQESVHQDQQKGSQAAGSKQEAFSVRGTGKGGEVEVKGGEELDDPLPSQVALTVTVTFNDKNEKSTGKLVFSCIASDDNRLYVSSMDVVPAVGGQETANSVHFSFDRMKDEMQDNIYDYLDVIGVDDRLGHFARQYVVRVKRQRDMDFYTTFHSLISSNAPKK